METLNYLPAWTQSFNYNKLGTVNRESYNGKVNQSKRSHRIIKTVSVTRLLIGAQLAYFEGFVKETLNQGRDKYIDSFTDGNAQTTAVVRIQNGSYTVNSDTRNHFVSCTLEVFSIISPVETANPLTTDTVHPTFILSNDDRTATTSSGTEVTAVLSQDAEPSSGKYYWEAEVNVPGANDARIGMVDTPYSSYSNFVGSQFTDLGWQKGNGFRWSGGAPTPGSPVYANGDRLMFAYDSSTKFFYVGVNGTWATGGTPPGSPLFFFFTTADRAPAASLINGSVTFYTNTDDFLYTPPTGYDATWS